MSQRSILITGCSSGIGLHAAEALKDQGFRVFAAARKTEDVEMLRKKGLDAVQLDVNDDQSIRQAVKTITDATGGTLDALFNNAGFLVAGAVEDLDRDLIRAQFETNVYGPMELIRQVLPIMRRQGHGRIVQNSSILGVVTIPYYSAYNASKFALEGFSLTLRQELAGTNIHVSIINPGPIQSDLRDNAHKIFRDTVVQIQTGQHKKTYEKLEDTYFKAQSASGRLKQHPQAVVKKLLHALNSSNPKIHYFVGWPSQMLALLHKLLPERFFNWLFAKVRG